MKKKFLVCILLLICLGRFNVKADNEVTDVNVLPNQADVSDLNEESLSESTDENDNSDDQRNLVDNAPSQNITNENDKIMNEDASSSDETTTDDNQTLTSDSDIKKELPASSIEQSDNNQSTDSGDDLANDSGDDLANDSGENLVKDGNELLTNPSDNVEETTDSNESRWHVKEPSKLTTSEGIIIEYNFDNFDFDYDEWVLNGIDVNVTIPSDYDQDEVIIAPKVFDQIAKELGYPNNLYFSGYIQAADGIKFNIKITNLSKYNYNYVKESFVVYPKENLVYTKVTDNEVNGTDEKELYNERTLGENHHVRRLYNTALRALIPGLQSRSPSGYNNLLTDELINDALIAKGYENGINDYGQYLLDFYNDRYGTNYTNLDNFPDGIIREILSDKNPYLSSNSAYDSLGISPWSTGRYPDTVEDILNRVNTKQNTKHYESLEEFIVDFYNNKYNENATRLVELSDEALDDFFQRNGVESSPNIHETNNQVNVLAYNYFYNKGLTFGFEDDDIPSTGDDSENYAIGEYSRNVGMGDAGIEKTAKVLDSNTTVDISNVKVISSGRYICNAFISYEFMIDFQFAYTAQKSNIIVNYLDIDTLEKLADEIEKVDKIGASYETVLEEFDDYKFVKVDGETSGTYKKDTIYVTYYYQKITSIVGQKKWEDNDNQDGIRPQTVTINLLADGEKTQTATLSERNKWSYSFPELPVYNNGKAIVYTITENPVDGYTARIDGFNITNIHVPKVTKVTVTKVWDDSDNQDGVRPDSITVTLSNGQTVILNEENDWTASIDNLPMYHDGEKINYTWQEEDFDDYELTSNTVDATGYITTITNTHKPSKIDITVSKIWHDDGNGTGKRPENISVTLLADGEEVTTITLTGDDNWQYTFSDLNAYKNGQKIMYSVVENNVPDGYVVAYEGDMDTGFIIHNGLGQGGDIPPINPQTGDNIFLYLITLVLSVTGIVFGKLYIKKFN